MMGIGGGGGMKKPGGKMDMELSKPMMMKLQQMMMDPTAMMRQALMSMMKQGK